MEASSITVSIQFLLLLSFATIFFPFSFASQQQDKPPRYLKMVVNVSEFPFEDYYDYIIVGGGTAGCPLAATLSQSHRVLILERGGVVHGKLNLMNREGFVNTLLSATASNANNDDSPAQSFVSKDGVLNARGRVLGGSSAINAGFYSHADCEFFTKFGLNWGLKLVNESYEWVERQIVLRPDLKTWQPAVRDSLLEAGVVYDGICSEPTNLRTGLMRSFKIKHRRNKNSMARPKLINFIK